MDEAVIQWAASALCQRHNQYGDACIARNEGGNFTCVCGHRDAYVADARTVLLAAENYPFKDA